MTIDVERRGQLRSALGWLASAVILVLAFSLSPNFEWSDGPRSSPYAGDFLHEYAGGWIVREGDRSRLYDPSYFSVTQRDPALTGFAWSADRFLPPVYPPFYYLWASPLSWLDYRSASHLFTALSVAALLASIVLIVGFDQASRTWLGWWLAVSLFYAPVLESLVTGQKGTLLLLIFAGTYRLLAQRALFRAGALFACAAWKPQLLLAVALVMLAKREWRFFAGLAATGAVLCAQSLAVGWEASLDWIAAMLHPLPQRELVGRSHNWLGFARLLLGDYSGPAVFGLTFALVGVTLITLFCLLPGRLAFEWPRFRIQFAAIVLATTLVSPHLYTYDLTILVLPLIVLARELPTFGSTGTRRLWLGALLLAFLMGAASNPIAARVPLQCSALAGFALLLVLNRHPTLSSVKPLN